MTDVTLTDFHAKQLVSKLHVAIQTLTRYSLDAQATHRDRNSVERTVIMVLEDIKTDLSQSLASNGEKETDIPF